MATHPPLTAFVTGASSGIGQAVATRFLQQGYEVWGTARTSSRLESLQSQDRFHAVVLDLNQRDAAVSAYQAAERAVGGGFDVVVNNAGYGVFADFAKEPFARWEQQLESMLLTTIHLVHCQWRGMISQGKGTLVNVASLATEFPMPFMSGYNVAKAGLSALSESLLIESAGTGVTVIDFRPGDFRTDFNVAMTQHSPPPDGDDSSPRMKAAWAALEKNISTSPAVELAADDLYDAVRRGRSGVVRSGDFFQTRVAPLFQRLVPLSWARMVRWRYFGLR